jgi:hypothetical protein
VTLNDLGSGLSEVTGSVHGKILADPVAGIHGIAPSAPPSVSPAPKTSTLRRRHRAGCDEPGHRRSEPTALRIRQHERDRVRIRQLQCDRTSRLNLLRPSPRGR